MAYTLRFSDLTKISSVTVPDMPPGINTVDTSLSLVGRGYPNYGEKIAENFLHLLENFAGPIPPENPIEGQLWFDTSDVSRKVLRVMDGTATATRWPNASGIYQQSTNPITLSTASLRDGDIWVDTASNQLKIYKNGDWTVVGPELASGGTKTGPESTILTGTDSIDYPVILHWVDDTVISITTNDAFTPNPVILGFTSVTAGINLSSGTTLNGIAERSNRLSVSGVNYVGTEFLRKNDYSNRGQVVRGHVVFQQSESSVRDANLINNGIVIDSGTASEYLQIVKDGSDAVVYNNVSAGGVILRTNDSGVPKNTLSVRNSGVIVDTDTTINQSLTVADTVIFSTTTQLAVTVTGGVTIGKNLNVTQGVQITGVTTASSTLNVTTVLPSTTNVYDIGTPSLKFRDLYVAKINGSAFYTPGMMSPYGSSTAPTGWVLCNGAGYSTSIYSALHGVVGYTYGGSAGTFNVPNLTTAASTGTVYYIIKT